MQDATMNKAQINSVREQPVQSVHQMTRIKDAVQFLHAALFPPTKSALLQAIRDGFFASWPLFTYENVSKYLVETLATIEGHLKRTRKGLRSTQRGRAIKMEKEDPVVQEEKTNELCAIVLDADTMEGTVCTDQTGSFPHTSSAGHKCIFVFCSCDANSIHMVPMKTRNADEMETAFQKTYNLLEKRGIKPKLNIVDNESSDRVEKVFESRNVTHQHVPASNHRANMAERSIQMAKNHSVSGVCATDPTFPVREWHQMLTQAEKSLNMLRRSRLNPKMSADAFLHGQHACDQVPLAPVGWRVFHFVDPSDRPSFSTHGVRGHHICFAPKHCRCCENLVTTAGKTRAGDAIVFFPPSHCTLPTAPSPEEELRATANEVTTKLQKMACDDPTCSSMEAHAGLTQLAEITHAGAKKMKKAKSPRVVDNSIDHSKTQTRSRVVDEEIDHATTPTNVDDAFGKALNQPQHRCPTRNRCSNSFVTGEANVLGATNTETFLPN